MHITQVIPDSFQEFEDHWSLVLFSFGCNFACGGCYNYEQVTNRENIIGTTEEIIDHYINSTYDGIVFLGGEPTIWRDDLIKSVAYAKKKKLDTKIFSNGYFPTVIFNLNKQNLVNAYSIDLKSISNISQVCKTKINNEEYLYTFRSVIDDILDHKIPVEVRTTKWPNVNVQEVQEYMNKNYPTINHIIQEDFIKNHARTKNQRTES